MRSKVQLLTARIFMVAWVIIAAACSGRSAMPTEVVPLPTVTPAFATPTEVVPLPTVTPVPVTPTQPVAATASLTPQPATETPSIVTAATATVAAVAAGAAQLDIEYAQFGVAPLMLDVYEPVSQSAAQPAIVLIHGGGGSYGDRSDLSEHAQALAAAGYVAFNIEYRLLDGAENGWPTQLSDAQLAVRWVRAHAAQYHVDPQRICVLGHSFGGQLAALLGMRDTSGQSNLALPEYSSHVACVVDMAGSVDPTQPLRGDGAGLDIALMGGTASQVPDRYRDASPLAQVSASTAPFLIFHGADDEVVPVEESRLLVAALHKAGVAVVYKEVPHANHFHWLNDLKPGGWKFVAPETLDFLNHYLQPVR